MNQSITEAKMEKQKRKVRKPEEILKNGYCIDHNVFGCNECMEEFQLSTGKEWCEHEIVVAEAYGRYDIVSKMRKAWTDCLSR
jgi:hypothetical protein